MKTREAKSVAKNVGESGPRGGMRVLDPYSWEGYKEVVPGAFYVKHIVGERMSVALYRIKEGRAKDVVFERHMHGESVGFILRGQPRGSITLEGKEFSPSPGVIMMLPGGIEHGGGGADFWGDGEVILVDIVSPPRAGLEQEGRVELPLGKGK